MKNSKYFLSISFKVFKHYVEKILKLIENDEYFISVSYKIKNGIWHLNAIFYNDFNPRKFLKNLKIIVTDFEYKYINNSNKNSNFNKISMKKIPDQNWIKKNKYSFKPIIIDDFYVYDQDKYKTIEKKLISIKIKSSYAFGTGYHESTSGCIKSFKYIRKKNLFNVLDYGTGSGILGICFKKKNKSTKIKYIDSDKNILNLTRFNIKENNLSNIGNVFSVSKIQKGYFKKYYYDIIIANILFSPLKILIKEFKKLLKKNAYLIISGILTDQKKYIINKYRLFNFLPMKIMNKNDWVTIIFKKL